MATTTSHLTKANIDALNELAADKPLMTQLARQAPLDWFENLMRWQYEAYKCTCYDHDCRCLALGFDEWKELILS